MRNRVSDVLAGWSRLMQAADDERHPWTVAELGAVLRHQLRVPVEWDDRGLNTPGASPPLPAEPLPTDRPPPLLTFRELFQDPQPPLPWLVRAKDFAKAHASQPSGPLPPEVARLLYFASIAVALARCRALISRLRLPVLREGFTWALAQPWVDDETHALFRNGLAALEALLD